MRADKDGYFSRAMTRFLEQQCVIGASYSVADSHLFTRFKAFWKQAPERFDHPALLGQFRVELVERGFYAEPGGKWLHWRGLTTGEQANQSVMSRPTYFWLILFFGEALKDSDLFAMLLQKDVAGGGKQCRTRHCFPSQKDWK